MRAMENVTSTAANMPDHPSTTAAPAGRRIVAFDVVVLMARTAHRLGETWVVGIVSLRYGEDTWRGSYSVNERHEAGRRRVEGFICPAPDGCVPHAIRRQCFYR